MIGTHTHSTIPACLSARCQRAWDICFVSLGPWMCLCRSVQKVFCLSSVGIGDHVQRQHHVFGYGVIGRTVIVFLLVASPFFTFLLLPHLFVTSGALVIIVYAHCGTPIATVIIVQVRPALRFLTLRVISKKRLLVIYAYASCSK